MKQPSYALCPKNPEHGPLLNIDGRLLCIHQSHDNERIKPAKKETGS